MKRIISLILVATLIVSTGKVAASELTDTDNHWAKEQINELVQLSIINGYPDGTFRPDDSIKVIEYIKIVTLALGEDIEVAKEGYWGQPFVDKAFELELIFEGQFDDYDRPITREEMAYIIINALKTKTDEDTEINIGLVDSIDDYENISEVYLETVQKAYSTGLITGYPDGNFLPQGMATRAEATVVIIRFLDWDIQLSDKTEDSTKPQKTEDGRIIRTWDLPSNADEFKYILADIPNEAYEKERRRKTSLRTPIQIINDVWYTPENLNMWCNKVEENLTLRTNVDYETIDYIWAEKLSKTYGDWDTIPQETKAYVDWVRENHIKIIGDVKVEPSLVYMATGGVWVRAYIRFKIESFDENEWVLYEYYIDDSNKAFIIKDEYYEGWIDVQLGTNVIGSDGSDLEVSWSNAYLVLYLDTIPKSLVPLRFELLGW